MRATHLIRLVGALLLATSSAYAQVALAEADEVAGPPAQCSAPDSFFGEDAALPAVSAALAAHKPLRIVVVGSASSMGAGVSDPGKAYPARLQAALARRLAVGVTVLNKSKLHDTAADMVRRFPADVIAERPTLVIWQTGTTDAVHHIEIREFDAALAQGLDLLAAKQIDVVLMDPQYSPHTEELINFNPYVQDMHLIAQSHDIMLFQRDAIMQHWVGEEQFGPDEGTKKEELQHADMIHECIAELLAWMIDLAGAPTELPAAAPAR